MSLFPVTIGGLKSGIIGLPIFSYTLWNDFSTWQKATRFHTN